MGDVGSKPATGSKMEKGQKLIRIKEMAGKPPIAYLVSEPDEWFVFISEKPSGGTRIPMNWSTLLNVYKEAKKQKKRAKKSPVELTGKQMSLIQEAKTVREIWREKVIKK